MYAQILKQTMRVTLIGDKEQGLPITHPLIFCLDINKHPQKDEITTGMVYNEQDNHFYIAEPCSAPLPDEPESPLEFSDTELVLLEAQAELYEDQQEIKENQYAILSALADLYEQLEGGN